MGGLEYLGVETAAKKNAPYIGGGIGALIGALVMTFTGKHTYSRKLFGLGGRALLPLGLSRGPVPRLARIGLGAAVGAVAGAGVGYGIRKG